MVKVLQIFIAPTSGAPMQSVDLVYAIAGLGLSGDRYAASGGGSFNRGKPGLRQFSLIANESFEGTGILPIQSRRNLLIEGYETPRLIGRYFRIGGALLRGMKYCYVCNRPSELSGNWGRDNLGFKKLFWERGGILVNVMEDGSISAGDPLIID
jgi:hypothetical protein